jgi:hypothetical protein
MTRYRKVERTTKGGSIKQHWDIDWIFYASVEMNHEWYSCTTKTLEEAEAWIAEIKRNNKVVRASQRRCP